MRTLAASEGYDGERRSYVLSGVLNGIDEKEWNPETDKHIAQTFSRSNFSKGKSACKAALQRELGLPERPEVRLVFADFEKYLDFDKYDYHHAHGLLPSDRICSLACWQLLQLSLHLCLFDLRFVGALCSPCQ